VVAAQVWLLLRQNQIISGQNAIMTGQREAADAQSGYMRDGLSETRKSSNAARRAANAARKNASAASDALATQREIERAYIAMSQSKVILVDSTNLTGEPDGTRGDDGDPDGIELVIEITNHGRTPGDVLGGFYGFVYDTVSSGPNLARVFGGGRLSRLFVLPQAKIDFSAIVVLGQGKIAKLTTKGWRDDSKYLWFLGEVDYRDRFGKIHRSMYCRRYSADAEGFLFGPETGPLNYDRPLTAEEVAQRGYNQTNSQEPDS
jgi:hypothetical protein